MLLRVKDDWDIKDVYYIIRIQSNASEDSQSLSVWTKTEIWKKSAVAVEMNAVIIIFNQSCHTCSSLITLPTTNAILTKVYFLWFSDINPCDECKRKAEEKGMEEYTCPCPNLVKIGWKYSMSIWNIVIWLPLRAMINKILISVNWRMKTMKP